MLLIYPWEWYLTIYATILAYELLIYIIIATITISITTLYFFHQWRYKFWAKWRVNSPEASFPFGNFKKYVLDHADFGSQLYDLYKTHNDDFVGINICGTPALLIRNPNLARQILGPDADHFATRSPNTNLEKCSLLDTYYCHHAVQQQTARERSEHIFTAENLRPIFDTILDASYPLNQLLYYNTNHGYNRFFIERYIRNHLLNLIGSFVYNLNPHHLEDNKSEFRKYVNQLYANKRQRWWRFMRRFVLFQWIAKWFNYPFFDSNVCEYFGGLAKRECKMRERQTIQRNDYMQLLLKWRNHGYVELNEPTKMLRIDSAPNPTRELNDKSLSAYALTALIGSYESSVNTIIFALYEIASSPDLQRKIEAEFQTIPDVHTLKDMESFERVKTINDVINEVLRKYPPKQVIKRVCTRPYRVPMGRTPIIPAGMPVFISIIGLHHDEKHFKNPETFQTDRFFSGDRTPIYPSAYLPFGHGPRQCVGYRLGMLMIKSTLIQILLNYKLKSYTRPTYVRFDGYGFRNGMKRILIDFERKVPDMPEPIRPVWINAYPEELEHYQ